MWAIGCLIFPTPVQSLTACGGLQELQGEGAQVFYEVASDIVDITFGITEKVELSQKYGITQDTVCIFKKVR